ncbi:ABC transporter ATP-binding protein [Christensenella intestinihominis]|uniref:ABC transporter ATP-binding protein n=1 Tax=Christensenella intestinihominis TaxID=1851429 RepID=UPI0008322F9F|nr:ABC transporter ATP-binding protein [Christensenella intestinihominis]
MEEQEYKVEVEHISKSYRMYENQIDRFKEAFSVRKKSYHTDFSALTDVSFKVKGGEILGIVGRNGAGKSTLLKIITGVLTPTTGNVRVTGRISSLLELGTGFNMEYSGIENIFFYCTIMGLSDDEIKERLDDIISFADIGDHIHQPVKTYSSGMFARLAFACAINVDPDVLIVDEILSVGDLRFQAKSFNKFKEFKEKGATILYVGHDIGMVRNFCDRAMWMDKGKIVAEGDPLYITAQYTEFMYTNVIKESYEQEETGGELSDGKANDGATDEKQAASLDANVQEGQKIPEKNWDNVHENKPIAHWGTKEGLITSVSMTDLNGKELLYTEYDKPFRVKIEFKGDKELNYKYLSAAISVKNRDGADLIVFCSVDYNIVFQPGHKTYTIQFDVNHMLAKGEYMLVVAIEDRSQAAISYYEYIEGVKYFKNFAPDHIFGMFAPPCKVTLKDEE